MRSEVFSAPANLAREVRQSPFTAPLACVHGKGSGQTFQEGISILEHTEQSLQQDHFTSLRVCSDQPDNCLPTSSILAKMCACSLAEKQRRS